MNASSLDWENYPLADLLNLNKKVSNDKTNDENKISDLINSKLNIKEADNQKSSHKVKDIKEEKLEIVEVKKDKLPARSDNQLNNSNNLNNSNSKLNDNEIVNGESESLIRPSTSGLSNEHNEKEDERNQVEEKKKSKSINKSIDDELNLLYKYKIGNDTKLKFSNQNHKKGHQFNYHKLMESNKKIDPMEEFFARAEGMNVNINNILLVYLIFLFFHIYSLVCTWSR